MMLVIIMIVTNSSENISDNSDDHGNDTNNGHNESVVYSLSVSNPEGLLCVRSGLSISVMHANNLRALYTCRRHASGSSNSGNAQK